MGKLKTKSIPGYDLPGKFFDGDGLMLVVRERAGSVTRQWVIRYQSPTQRRRREIGAGAWPAVSLDDARAKARRVIDQVRAGIDPQDADKTAFEGKNITGTVTFAAAAAAFIETQAPGWKTEQQADQWRNTLRDYAKPIASVPVAAVDRAGVIACLSPIWLTKPETALRVRGRLERILDFSVAKGWRADGLVNPAAMNETLRSLLPVMKKRALRVRHHPALDWRELPKFMVELSTRTATAARLLEYTILTASRIGESGGASWSELSADYTAWTVPAIKMKQGKQHVVPLSKQARRVLALMAPAHALDPDQPLIFPISGKSPSENATRALLIRMGRKDITTHGMRSTFRDWAADNGIDRELAEACLAHAAGGVEAAYRRSDMLERRRVVMDAWGRYCRSAE